MKRIVILGGGFGGAYFAQALEKKMGLGDELEVVLIDRNNYFIFYPLLIEAGTGSLEPRHAVIAIRAFLKKTRFIMAEILNADTRNQRIRYRIAGEEGVSELAYDHLVVALGSITRLPAVPGLKEYGLEMKSMADAIGLRDRVIRMLEIADSTPDPEKRRELLHFVIVGGNFTGVELAGELEMFLRSARRYYRNIQASDCALSLVEITDRILSALDPDLSEYALDRLKARGVGFRLNSSAVEIGPDRVVLNNQEIIPAATVIWCAGIAPNPLIASLGLPVDMRGYILCEADLRVKGFENVWAIGDGAVNPSPLGKPYPATAQHAVKQARHLAKNIRRVFSGQAPIPCVIESQGSLAALGCRTGVAKLFGLKLSGFPAWFLWRTVYLFKMPGFSRKMRVALDWTLDLFFPRDIVQLGIHRSADPEAVAQGRGSTSMNSQTIPK